MPLSTSPNQLGLGAPRVGPWFSVNINLNAPQQDLTIQMVNAGAWDWLPPASGTLSLHVATSTRPEPLQKFLLPDGKPAFATNSVVALFTLLPEVEDRLYALSSNIPPADGTAAANRPTRARVRYLAMQLPETSTIFVNLWLRFQNPSLPNMLIQELAEYVGLALQNGALTNSLHPMADLRRPGKSPISGANEVLLRFQANENVVLSAFDHRGRPLDPGAVAAWWNAIAVVMDPDLWTDQANKITSAVAGALTVHFANAHEGTLTAPLLNRLTVNKQPATAVVVTNPAGQIAFTAPPSPDDAPVPRVAMLPSGTYANNLMLWPAGNTAPARDFVRVTVVDVEQHLVGQSRVASGNAPKQARANFQNSATTRVEVARSAGPALLTTIDAAATAALATMRLAGATEVSVVAGSIDRDWGPGTGVGPVPAPPAQPQSFPAPFPQPQEVAALAGGDSSATNGQRILLHVALGPPLAGAWLRARPQGFNLETGKHFAMDGGGGLVDANGDAYLVVELPYGSNSGLLGMNFELTLLGGASRQFPELRMLVPGQIGGNVMNAGQGTKVLLCEQGQVFPAAPLNSGSTMVDQNASGYALVDPKTVGTLQYAQQTTNAALPAGAKVELTQPAFVSAPDGVASLGANTNRTLRSGLGSPTGDSQPFPGMDRLDCAATALSATAGANTAAATIFAAPALRQFHEAGRHQDGHPGSPASVEVHGTGVSLNGPAARAVAEFTRPRIARTAPALVSAATAPAANSSPPDPAGPAIWAAALKTVAASVEGDSGLGQKVIDKKYQFNQPYDGQPSAIKPWFDNNVMTPVIGTPLPDLTGKAAPTLALACRAMDRVALAAGSGCREGAISLASAFSRAEDFVYIETPAIDDLPFGDQTDQIAVWGALKQRAQDVPRLRVIVCIPITMMPGYPRTLKLVRDSLLLDAVAALQTIMGDRLAVFSPSAGAGRSVRFASTSVVVDDAYALTGTTHLWRRGLAFDSSLAAAVLDESLTDGRPTDVRNFRRALVGGALGLAPARVPDDPAEVVTAIHILSKQGSARLAVDTVIKPSIAPTKDDVEIWNPGGGPTGPFNILNWLTALSTYQDTSDFSQ